MNILKKSNRRLLDHRVIHRVSFLILRLDVLLEKKTRTKITVDPT